MTNADAIREELTKRRQELESHKATIIEDGRRVQVTAEVVTSLERILKSLNPNKKVAGGRSTKPGSAADNVVSLLRDGKLRNNAEIRNDLGVGNTKTIINRYRTAIWHLVKRGVLEKMHDGRFRLARTK